MRLIQLFFLVIFLFNSSVAFAKLEHLWSLDGKVSDENLGWIIQPVQPEVGEFVLASNRKNSVKVISLKTGKPVVAVDIVRNDVPDFGYALASIGDMNRDGCPDFIVGSPLSLENGQITQRGEIHIYRSKKVIGQPCQFIVQKIGGRRPNEFFGRSLVWLGGPEKLFVVTAPSFQAGTAYVFSAINGVFKYQIQSSALDLPQQSERKGYLAWTIGDIDRDGTEDFGVGAPMQNPSGDPKFPGKGRIYLYSGQNGKLISVLQGENDTVHLGMSLANAGDLDRDGVSDLVMGAPYFSPLGMSNAGAVYWVSGRMLFTKTPQVFTVMDGRPGILKAFKGNQSNALLGFKIISTYDLGGDQVPELLVSTPGEKSSLGGTNRGQVALINGRTLGRLALFEGEQDGQWFGMELNFRKNPNKGLEVWVGSPYFSSSDKVKLSGRVDLFGRQ